MTNSKLFDDQNSHDAIDPLCGRTPRRKAEISIWPALFIVTRSPGRKGEAVGLAKQLLRQRCFGAMSERRAARLASTSRDVVLTSRIPRFWIFRPQRTRIHFGNSCWLLDGRHGLVRSGLLCAAQRPVSPGPPVWPASLACTGGEVCVVAQSAVRTGFTLALWVPAPVWVGLLWLRFLFLPAFVLAGVCGLCRCPAAPSASRAWRMLSTRPW